LLKPYGVKPEKLRAGDGTFRATGGRVSKMPGRGMCSHPREKRNTWNIRNMPQVERDLMFPHKLNVPEHGGYVEHKTPHQQQDVPHVPDVPHNPASAERPLVDALEPGQSAILCELRDRRDASPEEEQRVRKLIGQGMAERWAWRTVLAQDHPLDCECEVCL
jgi:hypothetical protein